MNGIIYKCVKIHKYTILRMIQLYLNHKLYPKKCKKYGWIFLIILICWLIYLNLIRWSCLDWMVLHHGQKWIIKDQGGLRVLGIIRNLWRNYMGLLDKHNLLKILRIILFHLVLHLCKSWEITCNFLLRKKLNKMIIGKVCLLFLQAQAHLDKDSIKLWSLYEQIRITFYQKTIIVCMVQMLILLC